MITAEFRAGADSERIAAAEAGSLPLDGGPRILLARRQHPLIGLRQARGDSAVSRGQLSLRLANLVRVQVQLHALVEDRLPREVAPERLVEVLEANPVGREEDERVAVEARSGLASRALLGGGPEDGVAIAVEGERDA